MGACQCNPSPTLNQEAKLEKPIQPQNQAIFDLAPAPRYYIGNSAHKKKLSTNYKTLGIVPNQDRPMPPSKEPFEVEPERKRKSSKRPRIQKNRTYAQKYTEKIQKINGHSPQKEDLELICSFLKQHFVFGNLSNEELMSIGKEMFYCKSNGDYVFKQNDEAQLFFIIEKGEVEVEIDGNQRKKLTKSDGFGDLALLYNAPRSASIRCIGTCFFWGIDRSSFKKAVEEAIMCGYDANREFLDRIPFFKLMTNDQKNAITGILICESYNPGQVIVRQGDQADCYYIIKEGIVSCTKDGEEIRKLHTGDAFGEQALFLNSQRSLSVVAITNVKVMSLARDSLSQILGGQIQEIIYKNNMRWAMEREPGLQILTKLQLEKLICSIKFRNVAQNEVLSQKGEPCESLIILLEGECSSAGRVYKKVSVLNVEFMEKAMEDVPMKDSKVMQTSGVIGEIDFDLVSDIIGGLLDELKEKNKSSHERKPKKLLPEESGMLPLEPSKTSMSDLKFMRYLGKGHFGHVYLVRDPSKNKEFALKAMSKIQIFDQGIEKYVVSEKEVLRKIQHPFIVSLESTFKDEENVYFLLEYIKGIELFDGIRILNILNNPQSRFYTGSLILAVEYLHSMNTVYRDLKPENVMIDEEGFIKMVDLGTAKTLESKKGQFRTNTIVGTPHYMAPDVLLGKGYSFNIDLWSIGICLYEFMCGYVPFGEDAPDAMEIYKSIITQELRYPRAFDKNKENTSAKLLMEQLLCRVPERRLGGSYAALKAHRWFDNFNWDDLIEKKLKPPLVPMENEKARKKLQSDLESPDIKITDKINSDKKAYVPKSKGKNMTRIGEKMAQWNLEF